eukprot:Gb_03014 [translate_table: standard]
MKFKEGTAVEVCRRDEGSLGSWFRARIMSADGHRYKVEYEHLLNTDGRSRTEEALSEAIRPVPPPSEEAGKWVSGEWVSGDTIEVYDRYSWKIGKIVKVLPNNFFVIRLLEPFQQKTCHLSNLRPRLFWQDGKWVRTQQVARNQNGAANEFLLDTVRGMPSLATFPQGSHAGEQLQSPIEKIHAGNRNNGKHGATFYPQKPLKASVHLNAGKRKSMQSAYDGEAAAPKKRFTQKLCSRQGAVAESALSMLEKVDTIPYPRKHMGKESAYMSLFRDRIIGCSEVEQGKEKVKVHGQHHATKFIETTEAESSHCSVASSSSSYNLSNNLFHSDVKCPIRPVANSPIDDAQSSCECANGRRDEFPSQEEVAAKVHKLELYAYGSAMRAFYASGPLSWQQEALLTNLRLSLCVSNDEHLLELRRLCSAQAV